MEEVAIVTAASKGIGAACARELSKRGYQVALFARSNAVHDLAKELNGFGIQGSLTEPADLEKLVNSTFEHFGRIDAMVINHGHPAKGELLNITDNEWHEGLDMIFLSTVRLSRLVTPIFQKNKKGAIVNISSFSAKEPSLPRPVSSAFRSALSSFTKLYAERYAAEGIRMNSVLPGWVKTYEVAQEIITNIPLGRAAEPHELAHVVAYLLSSESSYITGQNILVDGGLIKSI
jgi:NAD(P)-dependent dehydrogenase (short-subunit alcohol dehydrogenase family)